MRRVADLPSYVRLGRSVDKNLAIDLPEDLLCPVLAGGLPVGWSFRQPMSCGSRGIWPWGQTPERTISSCGNQYRDQTPPSIPLLAQSAVTPTS